MNRVKKELESRKKELLQIKKEKEQALKGVPKGTLRISCSQGRTQFYHRKEKEDRRGTYITAKEHNLVKKLAQKEYDQKVLRAVEAELRAVERCRSYCNLREPESIYEQLHKERKNLITPIRPSDEDFLKQWEAVEYVGKGFAENAPEYYTARNERVRSKSEWMIANLLKDAEIPYRYEYPIYLKGLGQVYPDFMVLNGKNRQEFYWEHFGRMDDAEYLERALYKISMYEQNGIYLGEKLLVTFETSASPLNPKVVINKIEQYLKYEMTDRSWNGEHRISEGRSEASGC